jgi:hypothetical protein
MYALPLSGLVNSNKKYSALELCAIVECKSHSNSSMLQYKDL